MTERDALAKALIDHFGDSNRATLTAREAGRQAANVVRAALASAATPAPTSGSEPAGGDVRLSAAKMVDDFATLSVLYATDETPGCPTVKEVCEARDRLIVALSSSAAPAHPAPATEAGRINHG